MAVAYTNAWCYVELIPKQGKGEPFVINLETFPYLTSVKVTKNLGMVTEIGLDLDLPFDTGLKLLNGQIAQGCLLVGSFVRVRMGYGDPANATNGVVSQEFIGFLSKGGMGLSLSPNGVSGTITAVGVNPAAVRTAAPAENTLLKEFERRIEYAGYGGYQVSQTARAIFDDLMATERDGGLSAIAVSWLSRAMDHLSWINLMLEDAGLVGTVLHSAADGKSTLIITLITDASKLTQFVFVMRGGFDYDDQGRLTTYPIVNFSPEQQAVLFAGGADPAELSMMMGTIDRDGNLQVVIKEAKDNEVAPTVTGENLTPNPEDSQQNGVVTDRALAKDGDQTVEVGAIVTSPPPETPNMAAAMEKGLVNELGKFVPGISATLTTFGIPHIDTGIFVLVEGVGAMFTGIYMVLGMTHSWIGNDIETSLTLRAHTAENPLPKVKLDFNADALASDYIG